MLAALTAGCSDDGGDETTPIGTPTVLPTLAELEPGWNELEPGGESSCSRGAPYSFFVRPGTVNQVVIEFEGGGACWDATTCAVGSDSFDDVVDFVPANVQGIQDHDNADNPFRDWTHVFLPYCTGDLHWGNKTTSYAGMTIEHRGAVNARAALDWVYANFAAPERVLVTGCSAGGYGSIGHAPYVMQHYPNVPVVEIADCAAGIATAGFFLLLSGVWDPSVVTSSFVPGVAAIAPAALTTTDVYIENAAFFPTQTFAQYNVQFDETQMSFYEDMNGNPADWSGLMNESVTAISAAADNFASYVAPGFKHCIIEDNDFYTVESNGVPLREWYTNRANGTAVDDVHCGAACGDPAPAQ
jgi:hypothetical protein